MFSQTDISGNSARFWKISAVGRLFGPMPRMFLPPILISPAVGLDEARDHPQDGGLAAAGRARGTRRTRPALTVRSTSSTARNCPKSTVTWTELDVFAHRPPDPAPHAACSQTRRRGAAADQTARRPAFLMPTGPIARQAALYLSAYSPRSLRNQESCAGHHHIFCERVAGIGRLVEGRRPWDPCSGGRVLAGRIGREGRRVQRRALRRGDTKFANSCACSTFAAFLSRK